jgi:hypothetical protein
MNTRELTETIMRRQWEARFHNEGVTLTDIQKEDEDFIVALLNKERPEETYWRTQYLGESIISEKLRQENAKLKEMLVKAGENNSRSIGLQGERIEELQEENAKLKALKVACKKRIGEGEKASR